MAALVLALTLLPALVAGAAVNDTAAVSVAADGALADGPSGPGVVVNPSGRFVVFESTADNLSDADVDSVVNLYMRDRETGTTELISRATGSTGAGADGDSTNPAISPAGRFVVFESSATNLSDVDDDTVSDVFVRDTQAHTTTLISRAPDGSAANGSSGNPTVSANGTVVAFESEATNLSDADDDAATDIFTYDRSTGTMTLVSRTSAGVGGDASSFDPSLSNDGRRIAFASDADNLSAIDDDRFTNVFHVEPRFRLITNVSRTTTSGIVDQAADGDSFEPVISSGGGHVAFVSFAGNLTDESISTPTIADVFVRDVSAKKTTLVSRATGASGAPGFDHSYSPSISGDGRLVAFESAAGNLSTEDSPGTDVFVRDTAWDTTDLMSRASGVSGASGTGDSGSPALSRYGTLLAFVSNSDELTADEGDILHETVFARELKWPAPPVYVPPPDNNDHGGHGDGDGSHTDGGHTDGGHAAGDHAAGTAGHGGHAAGGAHYTLKLGGLNGDHLFGTPLHDKLCGGRGNDTIMLADGSDVGYGGDCGPLSPPLTDAARWWRLSFDEGAPPPGADGNDLLRGGKGEDALFGGAGRDRLVGGSGSDFLSGGAGADRLVGGPGHNRFDGGSGNDSINSANGVREMVDCGFGRDRVTADPRDTLSGCERVRRVRRQKKQDLPALLPECPGGGHECHKDGETVVLSGARPAGPAGPTR